VLRRPRVELSADVQLGWVSAAQHRSPAHLLPPRSPPCSIRVDGATTPKSSIDTQTVPASPPCLALGMNVFPAPGIRPVSEPRSGQVGPASLVGSPRDTVSLSSHSRGGSDENRRGRQAVLVRIVLEERRPELHQVRIEQVRELGLLRGHPSEGRDRAAEDGPLGLRHEGRGRTRSAEPAGSRGDRDVHPSVEADARAIPAVLAGREDPSAADHPRHVRHPHRALCLQPGLRDRHGAAVVSHPPGEPSLLHRARAARADPGRRTHDTQKPCTTSTSSCTRPSRTPWKTASSP
jgi:hypothetical protein